MMQLALFPLPNILLPNCVMPLHIFEECYLRLVEDCVGRELIGIIQPLENAEDDQPALHSMGCAGRIIRYEELDNGRFFIILRGEKRFHYINDQLHRDGYRLADIRWVVETEFADENLQVIDNKPLLIERVEKFLDKQGMQADLSDLSQASDIQLINSLAMLLPLQSEQRQSLLEAQTLVQRWEVLMGIFDTSKENDPAALQTLRRKIH